MKIARFTFNVFSVNTYILWDGNLQEAAIVDPGMDCEEDVAKVDDFLAGNNLSLKMILLTHQHIDHVLGVGWLVEKYGCPVYAHEGDRVWGDKLALQVDMFSLPYDVKPYTMTHSVKTGDILMLNDEPIEVRHTPGHSEGGVIYYLPKSGCALSGDTIFQMSVGRTDFPHGNHQQLLDSISAQVFTLPNDTELFPGHGAATTVEEERAYNPFLQGLK